MKILEKKEVANFLAENFKDQYNYDSVTNIVYICNNSIVSDPKFKEMLDRYKVIVQLSFFTENDK